MPTHSPSSPLVRSWQIEINPFLYRKATIDFFRSKGVALQSYRTLRDGKAFSDPTIVGLAEKHKRSAAQVRGGGERSSEGGR